MSKKLITILMGLCLIISVIITFQFKIIYLENGEMTLVYTLPFNSYRPGGSTRADLRDELSYIHGEEDTLVSQYDGQWKGKNIVVFDRSKYDIEYIGKSIDGGHYFLCKVLTKRMVRRDDKEEKIEIERTITYIGYDDGDLNSDRRAVILRGTIKEEYLDSEEYFNSFMIES